MCKKKKKKEEEITYVGTCHGFAGGDDCQIQLDIKSTLKCQYIFRTFIFKNLWFQWYNWTLHIWSKDHVQPSAHTVSSSFLFQCRVEGQKFSGYPGQIGDILKPLVTSEGVHWRRVVSKHWSRSSCIILDLSLKSSDQSDVSLGGTVVPIIEILVILQYINRVASRQELGHEGNGLVNIIRQLLR